MSLFDRVRHAIKGGGGLSRVPLSTGFVPPYAMALGPQAVRLPFDYRAGVREAFLGNPVAQRAVRIVADGVAAAPLAVSEPEVRRLIEAHSAGQSLLETLAAQLVLHGNAFVQVMKDGAGQPAELFALRPERMAVIAGADGWPVAYDYQAGGATVRLPVEDEDGWPTLIHLKTFHPADDHYGAGCLSAAGEAVRIHNAAAAWNRALLDNAARPSGALVYANGEGATLTTDQFDRLKEELATAFSGTGNAGRPLLLEGGLQWQSLSLSPAEMDFAQLKSAAARDIALAFGVPPMLLGLPGDNTYANYREASKALWRLTLLPLAGKILAGLSEGLEPWFPGLTASVDLDKVPALAEDRETLWAQVNGADFLDADEKRALLGLAPKEAR